MYDQFVRVGLWAPTFCTILHDVTLKLPLNVKTKKWIRVQLRITIVTKYWSTTDRLLEKIWHGKVQLLNNVPPRASTLPPLPQPIRNMKVLVLALSASAVAAFAPNAGVRCTSIYFGDWIGSSWDSCGSHRSLPFTWLGEYHRNWEVEEQSTENEDDRFRFRDGRGNPFNEIRSKYYLTFTPLLCPNRFHFPQRGSWLR